MKYFIAIYTHRCKQYCDQQFFRALGKATKDKDCFIKIVDNTQDKGYINRLDNNLEEWLGHKQYSTENIHVDYNPRPTLFLRNVCESVNYLRKIFLTTKCKKFIIIESDVIVPENLLELFFQVENKADIIGGIYYHGWHDLLLFDPAVTELIEVSHVLSGCTMYDRKLIQDIPFRWDNEERAEFPDSLISRDALAKGYKLRNYAAIKCEHLEDENRNDRGREAL